MGKMYIYTTSILFNSTTVVLFLLFSLVFLFKQFTRGRKKIKNSPPSPPIRLPIIGNLYQMGRHPHRSLKALADKYGPLMFMHFGSVPTVVVTSAEIAREVLKTHETVFINRPQLKVGDVLFLGRTSLLFCTYGEYWRQVRKICVLELLSIKRVQTFKFVREEEAAELVKKIHHSCVNGCSVDLCEMLATVSHNIVSRSVIGQKHEGGNGIESFAELSGRALDLIVAFCFEDFFPYLGWMDKLTGFTYRLNNTSEAWHSFLDQVIDEHEQSLKSGNSHKDNKDFVDILLHLQKDGLLEFELTRNNMKAILLEMLIGGTDNAAATMEWAMAELVKHPTIMKKAQEEVRKVVGKKSLVDEADVDQMEYLKSVIKETLRLHCPSMMIRESVTSVTLAGYEVAPKTKILINLWAIQRDPNLWDRPDEFLPERFTMDPVDFKGQDGRFCPFGSGRRGCPGIMYAVAEMECVLANLLYWFDWNLPDGATTADLNMDEGFLLTNRKKIPLNVVPVLHTP